LDWRLSCYHKPQTANRKPIDAIAFISDNHIDIRMTGSSASPPDKSAGGGVSALPEDKSHTFRKRKLSLTKLRETGNEKIVTSPEKNAIFDLQALQSKKDAMINLQVLQQCKASQSTPEDEEKAHSFRKRRLSLTHNREDSSHEEQESNQRRRLHSDASVSSLESSGVAAAAFQNNAKRQELKSRIVHASELLSHPPPSPMPFSDNRLYQQSAPPKRQPLLDTVGDSALPKWKKRHTRHLHEDERKLPFPRDIVGTFSCHGIEPIYNDAYLNEEGEDGHEKPTTAAKINQDRGGVAFPYGNCPKTALFAVYDGTCEIASYFYDAVNSALKISYPL
jgi:hypothetical protein